MAAAWIIAAALLGYVLGSVSFAVLIARGRGVDILKEGSGNPGATNVGRVLGKKWGQRVFLLDFLKGLIAAGWPAAALAAGLLPGDAPGLWMGIAGLAGAIAGHSFSIFLRFKGGKGVAAAIGGLLALMPLVMLGGLVVWLAVFFASRYVSLASIAMGLALMPLAALLHQPTEKIGLCLALGLLILVRHRTNLQRLMNGTEHKFVKKKAATTEYPDEKQ